MCVNTYKLYYVYIRECECGSFGWVKRGGLKEGWAVWKPGQMRSRLRLIGRCNLFDREPMSRRNEWFSGGYI